MLKGPLSERLDRIARKLISERRKKPKAAAEFEAPKIEAEQEKATPAEVWDATQVCCPVPPRNPGGRIL